MEYTSSEHNVSAKKIVRILPIQQRYNEILPAHWGVALQFDDGTSANWLRESKGSVEPVVGDFYVEDKVLGVNYVVPGANFLKLFGPLGEIQ